MSSNQEAPDYIPLDVPLLSSGEKIRKKEADKIFIEIEIARHQADIASLQERKKNLGSEIEKLLRIQALERELERVQNEDLPAKKEKEIEWHDTDYYLPKNIKYLPRVRVSDPIRVSILVENGSLFFIRCRTGKICGLVSTPNSSQKSHTFWEKLVQSGVPDGHELYIRQTRLTMKLNGKTYPRAVLLPSDNHPDVQNVIFGKIIDFDGYHELEPVSRREKRSRYFR